jgi:hypothetical protein
VTILAQETAPPSYDFMQYALVLVGSVCYRYDADIIDSIALASAVSNIFTPVRILGSDLQYIRQP